ncbi:16S rRNA (uracil(1498)-N(3))-methyltransferase [Pleurocapsales cyanobacterium LEGE 10410]|nr:16S rRNA (uracil(1498)-N(3))-methyltransferase [Pleurocapsales cyanobacterium LEGE 10410]
MTYRLVINPEQIQKHQITLDAQQQHYLFRVLRLNKGDRFIVLDGAGNSWLAQIAENSAEIIESINIKTELPVALTLITALPKGSGYEQVIRCCTELGVSNFIPVISDRTILKPSPSKVQRWRKIATEAAEQSERQIVPTVFEPVKLISAIAEATSKQDKYICVARGNAPTLWSCLPNRTQSEIVIATGCEGGWTETEIQTAIAIGYQPVSLGSRILRAITAPIVASSLALAALEQINN